MRIFNCSISNRNHSIMILYPLNCKNITVHYSLHNNIMCCYIFVPLLSLHNNIISTYL